jgi:hypothetical protein
MCQFNNTSSSQMFSLNVKELSTEELSLAFEFSVKHESYENENSHVLIIQAAQ